MGGAITLLPEQQQLKISFIKIFKANESWGILATFLFRTFYLPICYLKTLETNEDI
jgi:hypothetical protein